MQLDPESPSPLLLHRCLRRFCLLKCHRDGSPLFLPLLILDQRGASGKNRWKCEEESGDTRTIPHGYQSHKRRYDGSAARTISTSPLRASSESWTSRRKLMRVPFMPSLVFSRRWNPSRSTAVIAASVASKPA